MPMEMRVDAGDEGVLLMSLTGLVSQNSQEDVVTQGSGLSRGDKRRNERLARLRELVPVRNAIAGIDLADEKQAIVVCDHDSRVLARKRVTAKAWRLARCWSGPAALRTSTALLM
jgi:transposase